MNYKLTTDPDFNPAPIVNVGSYNPRTFSLGTLNTPHCLRLVERMKTGAPELHNTLHNDPFVKSLVMDFDADILIPMKTK